MFQVIQSDFAVEIDGTESREIQVQRGGFWERLFDPDPTLPLWQMMKTKVIQQPRYKPVIYRLMDKLIVHPSLMPSLMDVLKTTTETNNVFRWR